MLKYLGILLCLMCAFSTSWTHAYTQGESPVFAAMQGDAPSQLLAELENKIDIDFATGFTIAALGKPAQYQYQSDLHTFVSPYFSYSSIRAPPFVR